MVVTSAENAMNCKHSESGVAATAATVLGAAAEDDAVTVDDVTGDQLLFLKVRGDGTQPTLVLTLASRPLLSAFFRFVLFVCLTTKQKPNRVGWVGVGRCVLVDSVPLTR